VSVTLAELRGVARHDARAAVRAADAAAGSWSRGIVSRFTRGYGGERFQIPAGLRTDRTFLLAPEDARYVERTSAYLFAGVGDAPPLAELPEVYCCDPAPAAEEVQRRRSALSACVLFDASPCGRDRPL